MNKVKKLKDALKMLGLDLRAVKRETKVREGFESNIVRAEPYPTEKAKTTVYDSKKYIYEVITINWSFIKDEEITDYDNVYKNTYQLTLPQLFKFRANKGLVSEDIISIKLIKK